MHALDMLPDPRSTSTELKVHVQVLLNRRRRSTEGWDVRQVVLDALGGVLSLLQLGLEAVVLGDITLITGSPIKLLLALVSVLYDAVLIWQHVVYSKGQMRLDKAGSDTTEQ